MIDINLTLCGIEYQLVQPLIFVYNISPYIQVPIA